MVSNGKEFTPDDESLIKMGAIKYDRDKPSAYRGLIEYFPRAAKSVAEVSTFGADKYEWNGWKSVSNGVNRYSDAMMRHLLDEAAGEEVDSDSGLRHSAHLAWNALARLELILQQCERIEQ